MPTSYTLERVQKGQRVIDDNPKDYASSNVFDVASRSLPYERAAAGKNLEHVIEVVRAEGVSPWFANSHDESVLVMDGDVLINFVRPNEPPVAPDGEGSVRLAAEPAGRRLGWGRVRRGHMTMLPAGCAYQFQALGGPGVLVMQTIAGEQTVA